MSSPSPNLGSSPSHSVTRYSPPPTHPFGYDLSPSYVPKTSSPLKRSASEEPEGILKEAEQPQTKRRRRVASAPTTLRRSPRSRRHTSTPPTAEGPVVADAVEQPPSSPTLALKAEITALREENRRLKEDHNKEEDMWRAANFHLEWLRVRTLAEMRNLQTQNEEASDMHKTQTETLQEELRKEQRRRNKWKVDYRALARVCSYVTDEAAELRLEHQELVEFNEHLFEEYTELEERNKELEEKFQELEDKNKDLEERHEVMRWDIDEVMKQNRALEERNRELEERFEDLEEANKVMEERNTQLRAVLSGIAKSTRSALSPGNV